MNTLSNHSERPESLYNHELQDLLKSISDNNHEHTEQQDSEPIKWYYAIREALLMDFARSKNITLQQPATNMTWENRLKNLLDQAGISQERQTHRATYETTLSEIVIPLLTQEVNFSEEIFGNPLVFDIFRHKINDSSNAWLTQGENQKLLKNIPTLGHVHKAEKDDNGTRTITFIDHVKQPVEVKVFPDPKVK